MNIFRAEPKQTASGGAVYQSIGLASSKDVVALSRLFSGPRSEVAAGWKSPVYTVVGDPDKPAAAFPFSSEIHLLANQRAVDCLQSIFKPQGDFYPITTAGVDGVYWLYFCWCSPDILDMECTVMQSKYRIQHAAFKAGVDVPDVFTLKEEPTGLFVSERVRDLIVANDLQGLAFEPVGAAEYDLQSRNRH